MTTSRIQYVKGPRPTRAYIVRIALQHRLFAAEGLGHSDTDSIAWDHTAVLCWDPGDEDRRWIKRELASLGHQDVSDDEIDCALGEMRKYADAIAETQLT